MRCVLLFLKYSLFRHNILEVYFIYRSPKQRQWIVRWRCGWRHEEAHSTTCPQLGCARQVPFRVCAVSRGMSCDNVNVCSWLYLVFVVQFSVRANQYLVRVLKARA